MLHGDLLLGHLPILKYPYNPWMKPHTSLPSLGSQDHGKSLESEIVTLDHGLCPSTDRYFPVTLFEISNVPM